MQVQSRIRIRLRQFLLQIFLSDGRILLHLPEPRQQPDRLDHFLFLQRNNSSSPSRRRPGYPATRHPNRRAVWNPPSLARSWRKIRHAAERNHGNPASRRSTARIRPFGSGDQLQQFLRIIQPLLELRSQRLRRNLRRDADITGQRIGGHKLHLIDSDAAARFICAQSFLNLPRDILALRSGDRKSAHQANKIFLCHVLGKMQARQACRGQQSRKTAFGISGFQRNAI